MTPRGRRPRVNHHTARYGHFDAETPAAVARARRAVQGEGTFEAQQEFFACAARVAREARLSRRAFLGRKAPGRSEET